MLIQATDALDPGKASDATTFAAADVLSRMAAVVVVYRDARRVADTVALLSSVLPWVVVVNNAPELLAEGMLAGTAARSAPAQTALVQHLHNANTGGLAGAYNHALSWLAEHHPQAERVLFLDEDSSAEGLRSFIVDPLTQQALHDPAIAAVSPAYRDRATGLRGAYMRLSRWRFDFHPREFEGLRDVAFLINSMSVWKLPAVRRIGRFNEALAVDHVDTEFCLRARQAGLRLCVNGTHEFPHAIGQRQRYRFLGMELQAGGHSPARRCMIGRNTVWLAKRWWWREPGFVALCLARLGYEAVGITVAEPQAPAKLLALGRGVLQGLFTRMRAPA